MLNTLNQKIKAENNVLDEGILIKGCFSLKGDDLVIQVLVCCFGRKEKQRPVVTLIKCSSMPL